MKILMLQKIWQRDLPNTGVIKAQNLEEQKREKIRLARKRMLKKNLYQKYKTLRGWFYSFSDLVDFEERWRRSMDKFFFGLQRRWESQFLYKFKHTYLFIILQQYYTESHFATYWRNWRREFRQMKWSINGRVPWHKHNKMNIDNNQVKPRKIRLLKDKTGNDNFFPKLTSARPYYLMGQKRLKLKQNEASNPNLHEQTRYGYRNFEQQRGDLNWFNAAYLYEQLSTYWLNHLAIKDKNTYLHFPLEPEPKFRYGERRREKQLLEEDYKKLFRKGYVKKKKKALIGVENKNVKFLKKALNLREILTQEQLKKYTYTTNMQDVVSPKSFNILFNLKKKKKTRDPRREGGLRGRARAKKKKKKKKMKVKKRVRKKK